LYRAGDDSQIVDSLISASQAGKQVVAVVELQARFDEETNIAWARRLEEAGVQVVYGLGRYKTHSKISLVVRSEGSTSVRYCHIGSGNYNSKTAMSYEDVGLFTRDDKIGADVGQLFNYLTGTGEPTSLQKLVVSPRNTRSVLIGLIERQTELGGAGLIRIKTNGLSDPAIIGALYRASQAGVRIDALVRGVCCLRPGVPGVSENITVRSVVGRFLEHSRIYTFGRGDDTNVLIGSPDLMERSLERRIEVLVPIEDPTLVARLVSIIDLVWEDESNSWTLGESGGWERVESGGEWRGFDVQAHFAALSAGEVVSDRR
jgi:polyphosphate kinase 1